MFEATDELVTQMTIEAQHKINELIDERLWMDSLRWQHQWDNIMKSYSLYPINDYVFMRSREMGRNRLYQLFLGDYPGVLGFQIIEDINTVIYKVLPFPGIWDKPFLLWELEYILNKQKRILNLVSLTIEIQILGKHKGKFDKHVAEGYLLDFEHHHQHFMKIGPLMSFV